MREEREVHRGLYRPEFEHDHCSIGAVVDIKGRKSHDTVANALRIVENLEHRAGKDAEGKTGDGVGILLQISHKFFKKVCKKEGIVLGNEREYGIAQFFFPQHEIKRAQAKKMFEIILAKEGLELLGWRTVPVVPEVLGHKARECMPCIMQAFIKKPLDAETGLAFDRRLYIARREFEQSNDNTYVVSMSSRTIVYKGMFLVGQLRTFFQDLQDLDYESAIALVHSRFSTNTNPSWERAHPNRFIVHNGEINTIRGNADKMLAREENIESPYLAGELHKVLPVVTRSGSGGAGLLSVLCDHDGAMGRPGIDSVFRRGCDGGGTGPQRPAPFPLLHHIGRDYDFILRGRGSSGARGQNCFKRTPPPGKNASGGHCAGKSDQ